MTELHNLSVDGLDSIKVDSFDFSFDGMIGNVNGIEEVEQRVEDRMNKVINEELKRQCFNCSHEKLYDEANEEYYCPRCEP